MDSLDLSRRAVAAGWKWQAGALTVSDWRVCTIGANKAGAQVLEQADGEYWIPAAAELPDFNDAPTRGALLEQVRERWGDEYLCVAWTGANVYRWAVRDRDGKMMVWGHDSEAAALVAALEAAPKR